MAREPGLAPGASFRAGIRAGCGALFRGAAFRCLLRVPLGLSLIMVSSGAMRARLCEAKKGQSS